MNYVWWSVLALLGYTLFAPLASIASKEIPSPVVAAVANSILVVFAVVIVLYTGEAIRPHFASPFALHMVGAGIFLAIGILAFYRALEVGPVSIVIPIFGLYIVTAPIVGILFLDEALTTQKGLAIVLAFIAILLLAFE